MEVILPYNKPPGQIYIQYIHYIFFQIILKPIERGWFFAAHGADQKADQPRVLTRSPPAQWHLIFRSLVPVDAKSFRMRKV